MRLFDEQGFEVDYDEIRGLDVNCFGCWSKIFEKSGILFSPRSRTSSDNVDTLQKFHLCKKCFNGVLEFNMGKESPNYKKGNPTLADFLPTLTTKGNAK